MPTPLLFSGRYSTVIHQSYIDTILGIQYDINNDPIDYDTCGTHSGDHPLARRQVGHSFRG